MKKNGAKINFSNLKKQNNELRGDILVKSSKLKPLNATKQYYVNSTDEYPILFVIAALTKGVSVFKGIGDLANKESNRIKEMQKVLKQIGIKRSNKNELKIYGKGLVDASRKKIAVPNLGDHRIYVLIYLAILSGAKTQIKILRQYLPLPFFLKL